jgi:hypothetical protein
MASRLRAPLNEAVGVLAIKLSMENYSMDPRRRVRAARDRCLGSAHCGAVGYVAREHSTMHTHAQAEALAERLRALIAEQAEQPGALQKSKSPRSVPESPEYATRASVLGAHPCAIERIRNRYRHEVLLRTIDAKTMRTLIDLARQTGAFRTSKVTLIIDVDPIALS